MLPNLCWYTQKLEGSCIDHNTLDSQEATQEFVVPWPARLSFWICPCVHSCPGQGRQMGRDSLPMGSELCGTRGQVPPSPYSRAQENSLGWGEFEPRGVILHPPIQIPLTLLSDLSITRDMKQILM